MNPCIIDNCTKEARSPKASLCPMHYHRQYRHGDTNKSAHINGPSVSHGRRYRTVTAHGHPLARVNGRVYEHRKVLYDLIGGGAHPCHWCNRLVEWGTRGDTDGLYPDHLNGIGDDNRPENLAPSCMSCNSGRASQARADALAAAGWWSSHDTIASLGARRTRIEPQMAS